MDLSKDAQEDAVRILGRDISATEQGNVMSFDAFTEADVAEIRKLANFSDVLAIGYIRFRLKPKIRLGVVTFYYSSVIKEGMPLQRWLDLMADLPPEKKIV